MGHRSVHRRSGVPKLKIFFPLNMAKAKRRPCKIVLLQLLFCQHVRGRGLEHRDVGIGVGSGVGGQALHIFVHGNGHLLGNGHSLYHGACAHDGVAAGKYALAGGAAVLADAQQTLLVGLDAGRGFDEVALRTLTDRHDDAGVGVQSLAALHLRKLAVLALDGVAADQAVFPDLHRCLAEAEAHAFQLGDDIAVIGVGNSAMDCARTAIRNGARHVTCYARRDEECISASEHEVRYAKLEGVGFRFCKAPVEIRENGIICRDTVKGEDGKFTQVEGSETFYPHTGVIVSVSQGSENSLVKTTTGIETNQRGLLTVNEDGSTTREGVFAGGDAVMGARTVVEAVAIAKKVAESMDAYMKALPADNTPDPYAGIPVFSTPTSDVLAKQGI